MSGNKLTSPSAIFSTFKLKIISAVTRSLYDKLLDMGPNIKDFAVAQYAGRMSTGITDAHGFSLIAETNPVARLETRFLPCSTAKLHVSLRIDTESDGFQYVVGELVGNATSSSSWDFYEYTDTGVVRDNAKVSTSQSGGYIEVSVTAGNTSNVTAVTGEIRHCS